MTMKGTMNKFGVLIMLMIGSTLLAWTQFDKGADPKPLMLWASLKDIAVQGGLTT